MPVRKGQSPTTPKAPSTSGIRTPSSSKRPPQPASRYVQVIKKQRHYKISSLLFIV